MAPLADGLSRPRSTLAGAYIAFGGLLAIGVSSGVDPETRGTLPTLFSGAVFALGLVLVVLAGSELLTGNMALVPIAMMGGKIGFRRLTRTSPGCCSASERRRGRGCAG